MAKSEYDPSRTPAGPAVDIAGASTDDPTRNVRDLVSAENRRQDDLRKMEARHNQEMAEVRTNCQKDEIAGIQHIERLRADHAKELRIAEAARVNALREVDNQAVQQAAQVQDTRATALATQVAAAAEAMRSQVAATADAAATALTTALTPILARIEQLSQAMFETAGGKKEVIETQAKGANTGLWIGIAIAGGF